MRRNKQIDITRALALAGTFNFLCRCARACLLPFLTLYFRQLGLTPAMTGIVMGSKHLISLGWSPVVSLLSRHYNKRRQVIHGSLVCSAVAALVLLLIPPAGVQTQAATCNTSDVSVGPSQSLGGDLLTSSAGTHLQAQSEGTFPAETLPGNTSAPVKMSDLSPSQHSGDHKRAPQLPQGNISVVVNSSRGESSGVNHTTGSLATAVSSERTKFMPEEKSRFDILGSLKAMDAQHRLFFLVLLVVLVWELAAAPLDWAADDGLYEYLDYADASDRYDSTGVWGLLGAACGAGGAGLLVSQLSCLTTSQTPRTVMHFYCYAGLTVLTLPVATILPLYLNKKREQANGFLKVRGSPHARLCAITTLLVGVVGSSVDNFLLWQMQDHGSSELLMGLSVALAVLSQAAFPLLARRVSRLLSPGRVLTVGAASLGLQCFYYSFLWGPWAVLPAQVLSCFSSGAFWWAVRIQCEEVATPGAERSVRRVYTVLSQHLGSGLGSFAGGFMVQWFGLTWLFRGAAMALMAWCVCLPLLQLRAPPQHRINYSRLLAADASDASDSESEPERDWLDKAMEDDRQRGRNKALSPSMSKGFPYRSASLTSRHGPWPK
uniref:LOW QUALITY PROTEIN: major facilitator superfamily domain-containing protein 6-like n=1 Tax=Monopterus albus TaxID=43700 RepID=UPI0009B3A39E|nr:LOW QUALITY PROTEIN: major facilitator superfamily domain-containing protein 6-like [Monopterus albus]